jgi:hypothetical protein
VKAKYSNVLQYFGEEPSLSSSEFFLTLAKFLKDFADAKATVERIRRQEMKASKEEAANEKKIQQKLDKDRDRDGDSSLLPAAAAAGGGGGNDEEKRGSEDANEATAAGEKENALLSVSGILIPKLKKKSKRQPNSRTSIN